MDLVAGLNHYQKFLARYLTILYRSFLVLFYACNRVPGRNGGLNFSKVVQFGKTVELD